MKSYNIVMFLLINIVFYSCSQNRISKTEIQGTFKKEKFAQKLILEKDSFYYINKNIGDFNYICCDTITKGFWTTDKKLLVLKTPEILSPIVEMIVTEGSSNEIDSLLFHIDNPLEEYNRRCKIKLSGIYYKVTLNGFGFMPQVSETFYEGNFIRIYKPKDSYISAFSIDVFPNEDFLGRDVGVDHVMTLEYKVKNVNSNSFNVQIPKLSYEFLTYKRLKHELVKILNKNKLEWNGYIFKRLD